MDENQITHYLMTDEYTSRFFRGVMPYDKLPSTDSASGLYVVNTDSSLGPGKHWVCVFVGDLCEYFDSLGNPPLEAKLFIQNQRKPYIYSNIKLQGSDSDVCGDYCILFSYFRCRGYSMEKFVNMFTNDVDKNDRIIKL